MYIIYIYIYLIYIYIYIYIFIQTIIKEPGASKRQISQLVLAYGCFQANLFEIVEFCEDCELNMRSNMFFKIVISQLDSDLTAVVKNKSNAAQKSFIVVVVFTFY